MDFKKKLLTDKELETVTGGTTIAEEEPELQGTILYRCECGAFFDSQNELWNHLLLTKHKPKF